MLSYGTQFRGGDVPFDFNENLNQLAQIRMILGDKVPCHADPVYFHAEETPVNVSRHMIACLAGVPMLSMDLRKLTGEQRDIIRFWLKFYQDHIQTFAYGHWQLAYDYDHLSYVTVENAGEKIMILVNPDTVAKAFTRFKGRCIVLNLSDRNIDQIPQAHGFGYTGEAQKHIAIPGGGLEFNQ